MPRDDEVLEEKNLDNNFRFKSRGSEMQPNFRQEFQDMDDDNYHGDDVDRLPNGFHIIETVPPELLDLPRKIWKSRKMKKRHGMEMSTM